MAFEIDAASLAIIRDGQKALKWLDGDNTWEAWKRVGYNDTARMIDEFFEFISASV